MVSPQIVKEWLNKAEEDFDYASKSLIDPKLGYYDLICFHFQQAAEKFLKTYIVANELDFRKTHDLLELLDICKVKNSGFEILKEESRELTLLYTEPRYPDFSAPSLSKLDAEKAQKAARKIGDFVKKILP